MPRKYKPTDPISIQLLREAKGLPAKPSPYGEHRSGKKIMGVVDAVKRLTKLVRRPKRRRATPRTRVKLTCVACGKRRFATYRGQPLLDGRCSFCRSYERNRKK